MDVRFGIYAKVAHDIIRDQARLPTLPDVALRLRRAAQDENSDWDQIAAIIQTDAGLSAHLIQTANSPLYRSWRKTKDLKQALSLFGLETTRNLCLSYSLRAMFRTREPRLKRVLEGLWKLSARRAALSAVLARGHRRLRPDRALLAGLLQDVGLPLLYMHLEDHPEALEDPELLEDLAQTFGPGVGLALLQSWGFDTELQEVVHSRREWLREHGGHPDLADVVVLVNVHMLRTEKVAAADLPAIDSLPAFRRLDPGPVSSRGTLQVLDDCADIQDIEGSIGG